MLTLSYHLQSLKWIVPASFMLGTAPSYYALWGSWRVVSAILPTRVFEAGDEFMYALYQRLILFFFENCTGVEIVLYGDVDEMLEKKENVVFMSNHQCTVDWLIADIMAIRQGSLGNIRYILKDGLKYLPLYGYYFRQHSCVYVKRSGKYSEFKAEKQLSLFVRNKTPFWMVIFPEGTRFNPDLPAVIAKSRSFAKSQGFPAFEEVLCPRVKALNLCVNKLRPATNAVYDVSIAYSSTLITSSSSGKRRSAGPSLSDLLQGHCKKVHIHLTRFTIDQIPVEQQEFEQWIMERFKQKDNLLESFYSKDDSTRGSFGCDGRFNSLSIFQTLPSFIFFIGLNAPFWLTCTGRSIYWRLAIVGTFVSWVWVSVRS